MNTDRVDTDAPLNSHHNNDDEDEERYQFNEKTNQTFTQFKKQSEQQNHEQPNRQLSESSMMFGGKTSLDKMSFNNTNKIMNQEQRQSSNKNIIFVNEILPRNSSQESFSLQSQKQAKRNDTSLFNIFSPKFTGEFREASGSEQKSEKEENEKREEKEMENAKDTNKQEYTVEDQTTGSLKETKGVMKKDNTNQKKGENQQKANNNEKQSKQNTRNDNKSDFEDSTLMQNEKEFCEFGDIEIKKIEMPRAILKKPIIQSSGIIKYMENSLKGKQKQSFDLQKKFYGTKQEDLKYQKEMHVSIKMNGEQSNPNEDFYQKEPVKVEPNQEEPQQPQVQVNLFKKRKSTLAKFDNEFQQQRFEMKREERKKQLSDSNEDNQKKKFITYKKIQLVRRMIKIFEKYNIIKRFINIPKNYFRFLGDKASWIVSQKPPSQSIFSIFRKKTEIKSKYKNFNPEKEVEQVSMLTIFEDSKLLIFFKLLVIFASLSQCVYIPIEIAFSKSFDPTQNMNLIFTILPTIIFIIDIYVNFNLAFFLNGKLIVDRWQIASNYFFGQYWFDFLSIALQLAMDKSIFTLVYRLYIIKKEVERILTIFQIQDKYYYAYRIIRLVLELILSCHILSCTFVLAAVYSPEDQNWIQANNLSDSPDKIVYLNSIYYVVVTIATIGYGDIHPVSNTEKIFLIVIAFLTTGLFAYNVSIISSIVNDQVRKKLDIKKQIISITEYMTERSISRSVQNQILQQMFYNMKAERSSPQMINECLKNISDNLKGSLFNEYYGNIISTNKYFKRKFSKQFLNTLKSKFKEEVYSPGELLYQNGEKEDKLIYIRKGGVIQYISNGTPTPIVQEHTEGRWIGFEEFFTGNPQNCEAKCLGFTSIVYLDRADFLDVIQSFPKDKEKFCMIKDKILYSKTPVHRFCNICGSNFHTIHTCSFIHYGKKKEYIIQKYIYQLSSKREEYSDRRQLKYNSLATNEQVRFQLKNYRISLLLLAEGINLQEYQQEIIENNIATEEQQNKKKLLEEVKQEIPEQKKDPPHLLIELSHRAVPSQTIQDGDSACNIDSSLPKMRLPENLQNNLSAFGINSKNVNSEDDSREIASPKSMRKTKQSIINENGSIEYANNDEMTKVSSANKILKQKEADKQEELHNQAQSEIEKVRQKQQEQLKIEEFLQNVKKNMFIKQGACQSKEEVSSKYRQYIHDIMYLRSGNMFKISPQNQIGILQILPSFVESDQEFFLKYDSLKWENNEFSVIKNESYTYSSMSQIDQLNDLGYPKTPSISNFQFSTSKNVNSSFVSQYPPYNNFGQNNLSTINEEACLEEVEESTRPVQKDNRMLYQILDEVQQIKEQQDILRMESNHQVQKIESQISSAIQKTFTFSFRNLNHTIEEQIVPGNEQTAKFISNIEDVSFGKNKNGEPQDNNKQGDGQKDKKEGFTKNSQVQQQQQQVQKPKQESPYVNNLFQRQQIRYEELANISEESSMKNNISIEANLMQQSQRIPPKPLSIFQQQTNESQVLQPLLLKNKLGINLKSRQKEKIDSQFFFSFEKQNNWKTYFPTQNLSYIADKIIKEQRKKFKKEKKPPLNILDQSSYKPSKINKFRRLSELVNENRERKKSNSSSQQRRLGVFNQNMLLNKQNV